MIGHLAVAGQEAVPIRSPFAGRLVEVSDPDGVLGRLSMPIREGGTGELIYSQAGTRRVCGARVEDGTAVLKGTEVVVTRYERGIAYVRPWSEMAGEDADIEQVAGAEDSTETRPQ